MNNWMIHLYDITESNAYKFTVQRNNESKVFHTDVYELLTSNRKTD